MEIYINPPPECCGKCPCFYAPHPMHCQAVPAEKKLKIARPYAERPDWCPLNKKAGGTKPEEKE